MVICSATVILKMDSVGMGGARHAPTCGDLLQGRGQVGGLNGREHAVPQYDERQRQAPDSHQHQRHEVGGQEHVCQHRYACTHQSFGFKNRLSIPL